MKKILIIIFLMFCVNFTCFANENSNNEVTKDVELSGYSSINGVVTYTLNMEDETDINIKAVDYNLPPNLYNFKDDIRLRITYKTSDRTILKCEVLNYITGEIIQDVSEENIDKLFNIEYGKTIINKTWTDTIKLSELKENEIYKYTANSTLQFPEIVNDVGNCLVYLKHWHDETYEKNINLYKEIRSGVSVSFIEYESGDSFNIMYRKTNNDELLKLIDADEIIYLNDYNDGDALKYEFEKYIYNNTDKNIIMKIKDSILGEDSFTMAPNAIYGFSWTIDSITIAYSSQENNNGNLNKNGDWNSDGITNVFDIVYCASYLAGVDKTKYKLPENENVWNLYKADDSTSNGKPNIMDLTSLARGIAYSEI